MSFKVAVEKARLYNMTNWHDKNMTKHDKNMTKNHYYEMYRQILIQSEFNYIAFTMRHAAYSIPNSGLILHF